MTTMDHKELHASAVDFARRALDAYVRSDIRVVLLNAAVSLEHLCKAYLCSLNPALLADLKNGPFDSLVLLTGHGHMIQKPNHLRTVGGWDAFKRAQLLLPKPQAPEAPIRQLINVRDGVIHMGHLDRHENRESFAAYLRFSDKLCDALGSSRDQHWGPHKDLVDSLITESLDEIARMVRYRISQARDRIESLLRLFPEDQHEVVLMARQVRPSGESTYGLERIEHACPACPNRGSVYAGRLDIARDSDLDSKPVRPDEKRPFVLRGEIFACGSCDLRLSGSDELKAANLPTYIPYEIAQDVDTSDLKYLSPSDLDDLEPLDPDLIEMDSDEARTNYYSWKLRHSDPNYEYDYEYDSQDPDPGAGDTLEGLH
ncbi:hypothetical protein AB0L53_35995 [Nonomuraea sp. NPDC052129]|uniref:hypothetical protein n=1 Tax=Nonomuraea sp. NPDC052129 TaxID=3154651 RepID=UPI00341A8C9E